MMKLLIGALVALLAGEGHPYNPLPDFDYEGSGEALGVLVVAAAFLTFLWQCVLHFLFLVVSSIVTLWLIGGIVGAVIASKRKKGVLKGFFVGLGFGLLQLLLIMALLLILLLGPIGIAVYIVLFSFWVWMVIDCLKSNHTTGGKVVWICVLVFLFPVGTVLYYFYASAGASNPHS